ncbi:DUF6387 family protein [Xenorhabdus sp. TS4]|uniref:DUF6387 family protein n=1 Tax=Xenorhabdus sp. TS4 TaxID=1873483 RepID=UPI001656D393|nr:DUF6387 family protein [Xenorhabdus sp. TS4]MBC8948944.1 hypothetical protein [Xenorhabdus sp. TS4]
MSKATKKDLSWFSLDNYAFLNDLTLEDLIEELELRAFLFILIEDYEDSEYYEYEIKFERIFSGDPNITIPNQEEKENEETIDYINSQAPSLINLHGELPSLPSRNGVSPITFSELAMYSFASIDQNFFKIDEEDTYIKTNAMLSSVTGNLDCFNNLVLTWIDLDDATDDEIITSLTQLLPLWRDQLSLPEQGHVSQKRVGVKTLQKLISNRVLPILDLLLWEAMNGKNVTNPMISLLVFEDDPKDTQAIKESIKPFALESMSDKYTRLLRLYINKDTELGSTRIADLMRRDL